MPRKKGRSRGRKNKTPWMDLAADTNVGIQFAEPFLPAAQAAMNGDAAGAIAAAKPALKEAASFKNIGQALGPKVGLGLAKKGLKMLGVRAPKFGGRRLF